MRMQWKLVTLFSLLILLSMQFIGAYFIQNLKSYYLNNFSHSLNAQAQFLTYYLVPYLRGESSSSRQDEQTRDIENLIANLTQFNGAQIQVIGTDGTVIAATSESPNVIGQKNNLPEVHQALNGIPEESLRMRTFTGERLKSLALPIKDGNQVIGAVLIYASMEEVYRTIDQVVRIFITGLLIALILTSFLSVAISRTITLPIVQITKQARAMAEGDFKMRVTVKGEDEIGRLAIAFNDLSDRLDRAIHQNIEEREKLSSVLNNMSEGVIATNAEGRILLMNPKAREMLQAPSQWEGAKIHHLLRLPEEMELSTLFEPGSFLLEIPLSKKENLALRVTTSPVQLEGEKKGAIIVITDMTEEERLARERKEFVANVSHELRTPLTTMKSYLETMMEEETQENKLLMKRFLGVVKQETERMIRMVSDLLLLSRLDSEKESLHLSLVNMEEYLESILVPFRVQAEKAGLKVRFLSSGPIYVEIDRDKMHHVLDNLLTNALKYSKEAGEITVKLEENERKEVEIRIEDEGIGIPKEELKRIFDRFYRVDKARSRAQGGSGLGLSIAKEYMDLHGGKIRIESEVDRGTIVTLTLPRKEESIDEGGIEEPLARRDDRY
ncbi:MAG: HAMP domain-containing protein [Thermicanus sp.]|nr:HAMP domain-containing protein [Thermicanus sp.]